MTLIQTLIKSMPFAYQDKVAHAWQEGHLAGKGFPVSRKDHDQYINGRVERYGGHEGWEVLSYAGECPIVCANNDRVIAVGNYFGPWAVDVTDLLTLKLV